MTDSDQRILDRVHSSFAGDQLANAIIYVDRNQVQAGSRLQVGDALIDVPWAADIVFIDLEPGVNWGHACYYLAIRRDADDVIKVAARMPPFLKRETKTFRLLRRGPLAPGWAVATNDN